MNAGQPHLALIKADHDDLVTKLGRPVTQDLPRTRNVTDPSTEGQSLLESYVKSLTT